MLVIAIDESSGLHCVVRVVPGGKSDVLYVDRAGGDYEAAFLAAMETVEYDTELYLTTAARDTLAKKLKDAVECAYTEAVEAEAFTGVFNARRQIVESVADWLERFRNDCDIF